MSAPAAAAPLDAALRHVERLPLGEAVVLHNRESGAIVATNAFGALLIDRLRETPDARAVVAAVARALDVPDDDVRDAVAGTLDRWTADGLFLTAQRPFPMVVPWRPAAGGAQRRFAFDGRAALLCSEDADLLSDLDRALAPMRLETGPEPPGADPVRLDVIRDDAGYWAFRDGAPVWGVAGYELTRFHLLREIMDILVGPARVAAHLHASALARGGAALVFAGASGSGKSTLATLLLGAGAALAADDHVAIDTGGERLFAFPTRPNLKPGTAELPRVRAVIEAERDRAGGFGADFVPRARIELARAVGLAGFVFPRYAADGDNALIPLAPDAALRELIQTGSRVSRTARTLAPLVRALSAHPTFRLRYSDTDFAVSACLSLFDGRSPPSTASGPGPG